MFSKRLTYLRKESELTQDEISKKLNISRLAYTHYENGTYEPSIQTLELIADFYDVSTDFLLGRTFIRKPYPKY
ncbi:HTH-type transcriptional regulator Xre [Clostridium saccharobutylicum]|uniref:helix-turn-helix domain-containing protein n=1 Tax=Clostridium saccharobutylicum TaxID=169679 RepID=UPI00040F756B|nr:helix-turn-helix transcriptional regulator [Clostridium saccharobutylicum]AQR90554.1 HTH-type transcriptional regulator Xre [Clostridium saccharobutylicum]AQS00458.1 HTH-type transcriptional regulator Xre [Clostridium saccharobutylicum]AQS10107.1 HTH-type transcriptional regulator Xre [Clostridium saccharobutylicum]AQS14441.1 HTH-type transcriptional regulator Xre [Clostridium saccharobutylicum]MBA2906923.1 transcriptional regulator with XRE-family HTH domain [Clostridium saccharobutylicum]